MVLNGTKTEWAPVLSGVPRGTVIGPLLFILHVNEISDLAKCSIKMFAGDTKLYAPIKSQADQEQLESDVDTLEEWTRDLLLDFSADKCKLIQIGRPAPVTYKMTSKP